MLDLADLPDEPVPEWRTPTLATLTDKRFSDPRWIFERKFDGMRCLAFRDGNRVRLLSRNRKLLNGTYPELVDALAAQQTSRFVVDVEVVAFEGRRTSFARLQGRLGITDPNVARASVCGRADEGVIAKLADSKYDGRRSTNWLKFKCVRRVGLGALLLGYYEGSFVPELPEWQGFGANALAVALP